MNERFTVVGGINSIIGRFTDAVYMLVHADNRLSAHNPDSGLLAISRFTVNNSVDGNWHSAVKSILMRNLLICATLLMFPIIGVAAEPPSKCSVTLARNGTKGDATQLLGHFVANMREDTETVKSFLIPGTKLKAKVTVGYTDDSVRFDIPPNWLQDMSILISLDVVSLDEKDSSAPSPNAAIAEAAIVTQTKEKNLLRVLKFVPGYGKRLAVVAECSEDEETHPSTEVR